jgi:hypothetical protein
MHDFTQWCIQQWNAASADPYHYVHQLIPVISQGVMDANVFIVGFAILLLWSFLRMLSRAKRAMRWLGEHL